MLGESGDCRSRPSQMGEPDGARWTQAGIRAGLNEHSARGRSYFK